jgi:hypothetical protein
MDSIGWLLNTARVQLILAVAVVVLAASGVAALEVHQRSGTPSEPLLEDQRIVHGGASTVTSSTSPSSTVKRTNPASSAKTKSNDDRSGSAPEQHTPTTFPLLKEGLSYEVKLAPVCARPGEQFTAVVHVNNHQASAASMMPFYSDGSNERGTGAIVDAHGDVRYSWIAQPIAGEGRLVTQAQDGGTLRRGTRVLPFKVVPVGASC